MTLLDTDTTTLHRIVKVEFERDYTIKLLFDNGAERIIDLEPLLHGSIFGPLRDPALFRQVIADEDFGALVWPNGADIDPMVLYEWDVYVNDIIARRRSEP